MNECITDDIDIAASAGYGLGRGWYDREKVLERLEEYQRDLEQELADVSDLIKRLQAGEQEPQTTTV